MEIFFHLSILIVNNVIRSFMVKAVNSFMITRKNFLSVRNIVIYLSHIVLSKNFVNSKLVLNITEIM